MLKEERRINEQRDKPFYVHSPMLIAYWFITILFVNYNESIQDRGSAIPRHSPVLPVLQLNAMHQVW